jgi:hypothetical protein
MKKFLTLVAVAVSSFSAVAAFTPNMSVSQLNNEIAQRVSASQSTSAIVGDAKAAGYCTAQLQTSLVSAGKNATEVFNAMVAAGCDTSNLLPPTAAGGGNANPGISFNGLTNSTFGQSRATTVGGGGRTSASRS